MRTFFQPLVVPLQARGNMGSPILLKGMLLSPIILMPFLWFVSHKTIITLIGLLMPLIPLQILYWATLINYTHLQLPATNSHLLPGIKRRLFTGLIFGWLLVSLIATTLYTSCYWLAGLQIDEIKISPSDIWVFWIIASGAMIFFVFFLRAQFIALIIWISVCFNLQKICLILPTIISEHLALFFIAVVFIGGTYFFRVTHPNVEQALALQKRFINLTQWSRGQPALYKSTLLLAVEKLNRYIYLFILRHRIKANKPILYFGLGSSVHWSYCTPVVLIVLIYMSGLKVFEVIGFISSQSIGIQLDAMFLTVAWGVPFSIAINTLTAIERSKKEQRLMYLLPKQDEVRGSNRPLLNYIAKNNAITFLIFLSLLIVGKSFFYLSSERWIIFIICCGMPLYPLVFRDYRHNAFNNSKLLIPIVLYILIMIISLAAIMYWNLSVWGWNFGLVLVSLILFFYRWNSIMDAPPVLPADCP